MRTIPKFLLLFLLCFPVSGFSQNTLTFIPYEFIGQMAVDEDGIIWILAADGLRSYGGNTWTLHPEYDSWILQSDENDVIWFNNDQSIIKYQNGAFIKVTDCTPYEYNYIIKFIVRNGKIWSLMSFEIDGDLETHLCYFDGNSWVDYGIFQFSPLLPLAIDATGAILIGTGTGLLRFDGTTWTTYTKENGLLSNYISAVYVDSKGFIWVGCRNEYNGSNQNGISRFDGTTWKSYNKYVLHIHQDYGYYMCPICFKEDHAGEIWFGYYGGVGKLYNENISDLNDEFPYITAKSIGVDNQNNIYFGDNDGILKLTINSNYVKEIPQYILDLSNYPNPFNPTTTISFTLSVQSQATLTIHDVLGRQVRTLIDESLPAGKHEAVWDGCDSAENPMSDGIYFYSLQAGNGIETSKMLLIK